MASRQRLQDLLKASASSQQNDQPTFELLNVDVFSSDNRRVSLLGLSDGVQRTLTGQLEPLSDDQANPSHKEIAYVAACTFALDADDELVLCAADQNGWYNLRPSTAYQGIWKDMTLAVKMFAWLVSVHQRNLDELPKGQRKGRKPYWDWPLEHLFEDLGLEYFGQDMVASEAARQIDKHKEFLLECMLCGRGGIPWPPTPLYSYLTEKFPKQLKAAKVHLDGLRHRREAYEDALPIANRALKRKRELDTTDEPADTSPASQHKSSQQSMPNGSASTPTTNNELERRRHAIKGRSALRPSAAHPEEESHARETANGNIDSADEESDVEDVRPVVPVVEEKETSSDNDSGEEAADVEAVDIWLCSFNGCSHKITAVSQPDLQMLTEEHVAMHAYDNDARVQLVQQLEHASLPVSHLMEKVRLQARADQLSRPHPHP